MRIFTIIGLGFGLALFSPAGLAQDAAHGAAEYKLCASCHGFKGEGNQLVNAPALAGQEDWYLERQLRNFRDGVRGASDGDTHGKAMAQMTLSLTTDEKIADVVAYINTLPVANPAVTIDGDSSKGQAQYAPCVACHGANGKGNPALNAPSLVGIDDWYQLRQLQAFKDGRRGAHPEDTYGQQMQPMAGVLADDDAMRDVVSYVSTLR